MRFLNLLLFISERWYLPNYAVADSLGWGANRGCVFATQSCYSFMRHQIEKYVFLLINSSKQQP